MKEASLLKFYFVRYFFLGFGLLQSAAALLLFLQYPDSPKNRFAVFVFFTLAMILFSAQALFFSKVKRVAVSKKKICVIFGNRAKQFDWGQVKELKHLPFLNMYSLKLKGKQKIYFLTTHNTEALFGLFPSQPEFFPKRMSKI